MLPHGTGREARVAVFAEGEKAREAEEAGADVVGSADLAKRVEEGFTDFDVAIATPDQMGERRPARPGARPARADAEPEDRHRHDRRRQGGHARRRPASSSTAPTAARTSTSRSGSEASSERAARRELRGADRRDRPREAVRPRRAATSRRSRSRARWAPASTSTRRGRADIAEELEPRGREEAATV